MPVLGAFVLIIGIVVLLGLILSLPVMLLWNWLLPDLFHFPTIGWLQAWGLMVLCGFLFKSHNTSVKND
jgi:hypothetical protein